MTTATQDLTELDDFLAERWLSGLWKLDRHERTADPPTRVAPHLWKWDDVYQSLPRARDRIGIEKGRTERRTIRLVNPGMRHIEMTSHTMLLTCQMIQPGEVAPAHRHSMAALRFIVQGEGACTVVNGEKLTPGRQRPAAAARQRGDRRHSLRRPALKPAGRWGNLEIRGWLPGFYGAIRLIGFPAAVPLFVFGYARTHGGRWGLSCLLAAAAWAFICGVFGHILHVPWPEPLLPLF